MKEGTKLILDKLKDPKTYAENIDPSLIIDKVEELEKKLLQVEKYLNLGGIIADKNGKPCKHGDKVMVRFPIGSPFIDCEGELSFNDEMKGFSVKKLGKPFAEYTLNSADFELVEQGEKIDI